MSGKPYKYTISEDADGKANAYKHPALSSEFKEYIEKSQKLDLNPKKTTDVDALWSYKLYARYKQGHEGLTPDQFSKVPRPGMGSSLTGKWQTYEAWRDLVNAGVTAEEAQKQYGEVIEECAKEKGITL